MQLQGLDDFDWNSVATGVTSVVKQAVPVLLAAKQQKDLQKLNVARASQGLPPLDIAAYAEASAPVVKLLGGVDSGTRKWILWGGIFAALVIGGGVYLAVSGNRRGFRR